MLSSCAVILVLASTSFAYKPAPNCAQELCVAVEPQECLNQSLAYVPADGVTQCCDKCLKPSDVVKTDGCDPSWCPRVRCRAQTFDECSQNQVLVPRDGLCFCCPSCIYKKGSRKCDPEKCHLVDCADVTPEKCISQRLAFVPSDTDCNCCNSCQKINDVTEPITCNPKKCYTVKCAPQTIKDCNARQVLVPSGGCYCCDNCVNRKYKS